jgi:hypothetical protein
MAFPARVMSARPVRGTRTTSHPVSVRTMPPKEATPGVEEHPMSGAGGRFRYPYGVARAAGPSEQVASEDELVLLVTT